MTRESAFHPVALLNASQSVIRLPVLSSTPLGSPVVPLVYTRSAGVSHPPATPAIFTGAAATSAKGINGTPLASLSCADRAPSEGLNTRI